jgi:hypothetical protein
MDDISDVACVVGIFTSLFRLPAGNLGHSSKPGMKLAVQKKRAPKNPLFR